MINRIILQVTSLLIKYKTPILYSGGSIAKALATIIVGIAIAKYISPEDLGIWTTLNLLITYSLFVQAGLINGLNLELPLAYGQGNNEFAKKMAGTVQTFTLISSSLVLIIGISYFLFFQETNTKIKYGLLSMTLLIGLSFYQNYLLSTFRSNNSFIKLSVIQTIDAGVNIATLVLVIYFSYYGLIIKAVLVILIYVLLLHIFRPIKVRLIWDKNAFKKVMKVGLPIFGLVYLDSLSSTIDRLFLLKYSNFSDVGLYSFAFYALSVFTLFSTSIASYIYPRMTYSYGQTNDKHILWLYVKKLTLGLIAFQVPFAIVGYIIIPKAIITYFPNYTPSISSMQILLFAGLFKGSVIGVNALWSLKNWKYMIIYQAFYSLLLITLTYSGIKLFENKVEGVSYGVFFANLINMVSGLYLTYLATNSSQGAQN